MRTTRRDFVRQVGCGLGAVAGMTTSSVLAAFKEYGELDGIGLANLVRQKAVKPEELLETAVKRLEAVNPKLNAVVSTMYDEAKASIKQGLPDGPFTGVPFLLKDLDATYAGVRNTSGSRLFAEFVPDYDNELVKRYKKAGLVTFGRTNTPEFGLNVSTEPALFGPARNPWSLERSTGGSSGGSAAAVAARIVPMAHGNDGGGSIRIPASCCGVFGMKPSRGRIPTGPDFGEIWEGFATDHVISLSVRDSAAMLDATSAPEVGAPYAIPAPKRNFTEEARTNPGRLRIAWTAKGAAAQIHADCKAAVEDAARLCESLGHAVEEAAPKVDYEPLLQTFELIIDGHTAAMLDQFAPLVGKKVTADMVEPWTWARAERGWKASAAEFAGTKVVINSATRALGNFFQQFDVLLTPTLGTPPPLLGIHDTRIPFEKLWPVHFDFIPFTWIHNVAGTPAMSVPLYWNREGLPIGVQFASRYANEGLLFRLAAQLAKARPWRKRVPRIVA